MLTTESLKHVLYTMGLWNHDKLVDEDFSLIKMTYNHTYYYYILTLKTMDNVIAQSE